MIFHPSFGIERHLAGMMAAGIVIVGYRDQGSETPVWDIAGIDG